MPVGQPTKYRPAYDEDVVAFMGRGFSLTAFAGEIGVSRETVYEWERTIPSFSDALKKARARRVWALEARLLSAANSADVTTSIFSLKNACPSEWRDKIEVDQTVRHEQADYDTSGLEASELEQFRDLLARVTRKKDVPADKANGATKH